MESVGLELPIVRLHRDALSLVFSAAWEETVTRDQRSALTVPLTLSHVCRQWRAVALTQPRLWTEFFWKPGDSVEAALAVLERSRAAPLRMHIALGKLIGTSETDDIVTLDMLAEGHNVLEAAKAHFHRVANLKLSFGLESLHSTALAPLFDSEGPQFNMPRLRFIDVEFTDPRPLPLDLAPRLNIASPPLISISLNGVHMVDVRRFVGRATTHIEFNCLNLALADLCGILDLAPNLRLLHIFFCRVFQDPQGPLFEAPRVSSSLDSVNILSPQRETLRLLRMLIPAEALLHVREVGVLSFRAETPLDAALEFLHIDKLCTRVSIVSIEVSRHGLQFITDTGMERNLSGDMPSLDFLRELFTSPSGTESTAGSGVVSALRELSVGIDFWADLMRLFEAAGACLPALEEVRLSISQDDFLDHGGAESDFYNGARIAAPQLQSIEVCLYGRVPPTLPLVQRYIHALWSFLPPQDGEMSVMYYDRSHDENLLPTFFDIYETEMERLRIAVERR